MLQFYLRCEGDRGNGVVASASAADEHAAVRPQLAALNHANGGKIAEITNVAICSGVGLEQGDGSDLCGCGQLALRLDHEVHGPVEHGAAKVDVGGGFGQESNCGVR